MPPSWTVVWAFERRLSWDAAESASLVSGNSQNPCIEMRGTGRSCGAAPKDSLSSSFAICAAWLVGRTGNCARLLVALVRLGFVCLGDHALLIFAHHIAAPGGIGCGHILRAEDVAGTGDHRGDVLLHRTAEIGRGIVCLRVGKVGGPVAAGLGVRGVTHKADFDATILAGGLARSDQNARARNAHLHQSLTEIGKRR